MHRGKCGPDDHCGNLDLPIPLVQLIDYRADPVSLLVILKQRERVQFIQHQIEEPHADLQRVLPQLTNPRDGYGQFSLSAKRE